MIDREQYIKFILRPTLIDGLDLYSMSAEKLLLGTMAQESDFGTYIRQIGNGPALGFYQMEPATYEDIIYNYLKYKKTLLSDITDYLGYTYFPNSSALMHDLKLQVIMARLHYRRLPYPLPAPDDVNGLAKYWKNYYNTQQGKGTEEEFITHFMKHNI